MRRSALFCGLIHAAVVLYVCCLPAVAQDSGSNIGEPGSVLPGLLWLDTDHEGAAVNRKQVAITASGEYVLSGWWVNNERVQLYHRDGPKRVAWRADIVGTDWFLPLESDDLGQTLICATQGNEAELQSFLYVWDFSSPIPDHQLLAPTDHIWVDAATCADGRYIFGLAQGPGPLYPCRALCFDRQNGMLLWSHQMEAQCVGLDCSADGLRLAVSSRYETDVMDTITGQRLDRVEHLSNPAFPALSGNGERLAMGSTSGVLTLFAWNGSAYDEEWRHNFPEQERVPYVSAVDISDDGSTVAAGTLDFPGPDEFGGSCFMFNVGSPLPLLVETGFGDQVNEVELTADGARLAAVSHGRENAEGGTLLLVLDRDSGRRVYSLGGGSLPGVGSALSVALSANGRDAAIGGKACHAREVGDGGYVAMVRLATSFLSFLDREGGETDELLTGLTQELLLEDLDANSDPGTCETVMVRVMNIDGGDEETALLEETGPDSGLFHGAVETVFNPAGPPVAGDGWLDCRSGDLVRAVYRDVNDPEDLSQTEVRARWRTQLVAAPGPAWSNPGRVLVSDPFGQADLVGEMEPYGGAVGYGLRLALGDIDGDGVDEIVTGPGPGPGYGPLVKAFKADGSPLDAVSFMAYGTWRYGVNVACGDIDGDGVDEIVTGAGPGAVFGPHVRAWSADGGQVIPLPGVSFLAYGTHRYGVNVACGDVDGDGLDEIITGAGPGAMFGPHVRGWNVDDGLASPLPGVSYLAYGTHRFGVSVACGDLEGDGTVEIITGPGPGNLFPAHLRAWRLNGGMVEPVPEVSFLAFDGAYRFGASVAAGDLDLDGRDELIATPGPDPQAPCRVRGFEPDGSGIIDLDYCDFLAFDGEVSHGGSIAAGSLR